MAEFQILHFTSVTSTQEIARRIMKENIVVVADEQKSGYGRNGRKWHSPYGGLWFTVILKSKIPEFLTLSAAVAVAKALEKKGITVGIKWPNDVIYNGKKLAGIIAEKTGEFVLLGIGINLKNEIPKEIENIAISIRDIEPEELLISILNELEIRDKEKILKEWRKYNITLGKNVCVKNGEEICGLAKDISDDGSLIIEIKGEEKKIYAGDVHIIQTVA